MSQFGKTLVRMQATGGQKLLPIDEMDGFGEPRFSRSAVGWLFHDVATVTPPGHATTLTV